MASDLAHAYAVVVGCEDYTLTRWPLDGPAFDALDMGAWLVQAGMPAQNLHLLASPIESNRARFEEARARLGKTRFHGPATSGVVKDVFKTHILKAIGDDGSKKRSGQLLVFWSGHGIVQRHHAGYDRIVFCTDLQPNALECIAIPVIAGWLASELPNFQLIFLVDACASESSKLGVNAQLSPISLPPGSGIQGSSKTQFLAYACRPGQVARNQSGSQRGLFTSALMARLEKFRPLSLMEFRDIDGVVEGAADDIRSAHPAGQCPVFDVMDWRGNRRLPAPEDPSPRGNQAPLSELAAHLCDRSDQWREFRLLAERHLAAKPERPMIVLTHGNWNQSADAFLDNLSHRLATHKLSARAVMARPHFLPSQEWAGLTQDALDRELTRQLANIFGASDQETLSDLAARISARGAAQVLLTPVDSALIRNDPLGKLAPLLHFWERFPPVSDGLLVVIVHIEYPIKGLGVMSRLFHDWRNADREVRKALKSGRLATGGSAPVDSLPTELGMVALKDITGWINEIIGLHRSWRKPTTTRIGEVFDSDQQWAMEEVVKRLKIFINEGNSHDTN